MHYTFKGRLCGLICTECPEPLSRVKVRLYRSRKDQNVTALAVAHPKDTFAILTDDAVRAKESSLIAEAETDEQGNFTFELGERQKYDGEAFEVDIYCGTVPHRKPTPQPPKPLQFSITTLQPLWRQTERGLLAVWDYCLPHRFWCGVRARFGAWTICGQVTVCNTETPVAGVKVRAFDVDWLQDDDLGFAVTDGDGKFRIDYLTADFQRTIFPTINLEWIGGPDLYFRIETLSGDVVLAEPSSRGRQPDRENVGHCFCVDLCVDVNVPPPFKNPLFTHVGDFHILTDISPASGLTNSAVAGHGGPNYGFFGGMKLRGFCPKTAPVGAATPMRYRFLYATLADPTNLIPLTGDKILKVLVGSRLIQWKLVGNVLAYTFQSIFVAGSGATPDPTPTPVGPGPWGPVPEHVIVPDAQGWINVDQNGLDDGFYGPLIRFNSAVALPGGAAPGNGAGNPVSAANQRNGVPIRIVFEAARVGGPVIFSNEVSKVVVNNWNEVSLVNLQQFLGAGATSCSGLSNNLNILYSVDHELIASWGLGISSAAAFPAPALPSGTVPRGGFGNQFVNISTWPNCSYIVSLTTRRALTDGENDDPSRTNLVTFCKG